MKLTDIIKSRRAIYPKEFNGNIIENDTIQNLLENAQWAPSHGCTCPWLFKVYTGKSLNQLVEQFKKHHRQYTNAAFQETKIEKVERYKTQCSHIVAICVNPSKKHPLIEETNATAMAVQNLWLSLGDYPGIGGYWSTGNGTYTPEMDTFLNLQNEGFCMGFFLLGELENKRSNSNRPPMDENIEWQ